MKTCFSSLLALLLSFPAWGDVQVRFQEGAPKDLFVIANRGDCPLSATRIVIELADSAAGLIFDVTETGAGVEVYQPFEIVAGERFLTSTPEVDDGDTAVVFELNGLPVDGEIAFTIDVDDTAGTRATTVTGQEIKGGEVFIENEGGRFVTRFGADSIANLAFASCTS